MKENKENRVWIRPELVVLVRSNSAESVLTTCKTATAPTEPGGQDNGCRIDMEPCEDCSFLIAS